MFVRRDQQPPLSCSLRFQVDAGKGVLRVSRPGVLIVPPARNHGFEDRLTPDQLRQSQFLHIPGSGRPRVTYQLDRLDEEALDGLDPETWHQLEVVRDAAGAYLQVATDDHQVLALGGELSGPSHLDAPDPEALARVAGIVEIVSARRGPRDQDDDEVIEADPESAVSALALGSAESPDTEDVESALAEARNADDQGELASEAALDALSFADEVGLYLPDQEDADDSPSEGDQGLPTSPPVHPLGLLGTDADPAEDSQPTSPVPALDRSEEDDTDIQSSLESSAPEAAPILAAPHLAVDLQSADGDRFLVRHLRWDLDRHRMQVVELQARVERLEERLRRLGVDPDELT